MSQHGLKNQSRTILSNGSLTALVPIWDSGEQTLLLSHGRTFRVGRGNDCDLVIGHPGVAAWHATMVENDGVVSICPEQNQHVWINDQLIDASATIQVGDTLAIGPATFRVESRRSGRRLNQSRPKKPYSLPDVSVRLEKQLNDLQEQYRHVTADSCPPIASDNFQSFAPSFSESTGEGQCLPSHATPFLDFAADTNRRSALDERENQLNEWHRSLDRRRQELDKRSANLTKQQAALTVRQAELDQRTAELESWHQTALEDIEDRKASVHSLANADLSERRQELLSQERELQKEQQQVAEQLNRMEDSRQSIADQLKSLEEARQALKDERAELTEERSRLEAEAEAQQQATSEQEAAFQQQRQKLDDFADQLEGERTALQQQEARLKDEQQRLEARNSEVAEAEERLQNAALPEASAAPDVDSESSNSEVDDHPTDHTLSQVDAEATESALQLLEEQKANLAEQQATIQSQLDAIQRKEDEVDLLRADVEAQQAQLSNEQVALEFERAEASTELEEARRLQQEFKAVQDDTANEPSSEDSDEDDSTLAQPTANDDALHHELVVREQELSERTQELANRLVELKAWKKQLEAREQANAQQSSEAAAEPAPQPVERPQSVIASQLSSLLMPPGMVPETDGLQDSTSKSELLAVQQENTSLQAEATELKTKVADLELQVQAAEKEATSLSAMLSQGELPASKGLTEHNLLSELQALKSELADSHQSDADATEDGQQVVVQSQIAELEARNQAIIESHQAEVLKYETTIGQLNDQLDKVQKQFEVLEQQAMQAVASPAAQPDETAGQDDETIGKLSQMVEQLSEKLEQRESTITNLQAQLNGGIPVDPAAPMTPQELRVMSQELDSRTVLLDERESGLRERERLLEHAEQELQNQRVTLQEARQQLELARAEIHSAREPEAAESMLLPRDLIDSVTELSESAATSEAESLQEESPAQTPEEDTTQQSSVRSEIAELFGLGGKPKAESPVEEPPAAPTTAAELMEAVDDYSQESAAAVSLSFKSAQDMLIAPEPESEPIRDEAFEDTQEEAQKPEPDDVVASYMEQLLSRTRATADGEVVEERPKTVPNQTVASKPEPAKKAPGQASFIDQYLSGEYGSDKAADSVEPAADTEGTVTEDQQTIDESAELRRSKIDRDAQRLDLQSFRELSTQSAANAIATHARRQQKGGIATRTTILTTLGLICVFVWSAAVIGVIPFGWFTTLSVLAVVVSAIELALKVTAVRNEVKKRTQKALMNTATKQETVAPSAPMNVDESQLGEPEQAAGEHADNVSSTCPLQAEQASSTEAQTALAESDNVAESNNVAVSSPEAPPTASEIETLGEEMNPQ